MKTSSFKLGEKTKKSLLEYSQILDTSMTEVIELAVAQFNHHIPEQNINVAIQKAKELPIHLNLIAVFNDTAIGINEGIIDFLKKGTPVFKRDSLGALNLHLIIN